MLKIVSFDVVGTLLDSNFENYFWDTVIPRLYAEKRGIDFKKAKDYIQREYDQIGNKDIRWYHPSYWFERFDLDEDALSVLRSHTNKVSYYPETHSVLKKLSQKYDLIVVSGSTREIIEIMIEKVRHYFNYIFSPISDRNEVKKTPQLFEMICKVLNTGPDRIAHVGDDWYSDFISPSQLGIKSFYLDRAGKKGGKYVIRDLNELNNRLSVLQSF